MIISKYINYTLIKCGNFFKRCGLDYFLVHHIEKTGKSIRLHDTKMSFEKLYKKLLINFHVFQT